MFSLTKQERNLVAFVIAALLVGSVVRYYRAAHAKPETIQSKTETKPK